MVKQKIIRIEIWEEKEVEKSPYGVFVRAKESYFHPGQNQVSLDVSCTFKPVARFSFPKKFSVDKQDIGKWIEIDPLVNPIYLAKLFHDVYEKIAKKEGWKTQESTQVEFHELPKDNQRTMVRTCNEIMKQFYVIAKERK